MRIALYKDEYGVIQNLREFPCVEINLDEMTPNTDYTFDVIGNEQTIQGVTFRVRNLYVKNSGITKIGGISQNPDDLIMRPPFWTWNNDTSQRMWMGGHFTAQTFDSQPADWENAVYYKYYNYTADASWIQHRSPVSTTYDPGTTYYTCDSEEYEPQKVYYGRSKYAPSFVVGQMLGTDNALFPSGASGGMVCGYCCGVGLGSASNVDRTRLFAIKGTDEEYTGYAGMHAYTGSTGAIYENRLNEWTLVGTPAQDLDLPFVWMMAHITWNAEEYIGWGPIRFDSDHTETPYLANFVFVPIVFFNDAIVPDAEPYSSGTPAGNPGGQGGYGSGLPDGDNFGPSLSGGSLTPLGYGVNAYQVLNSDIGALTNYLWGRTGGAFGTGGIWEKFKNYKFNPIAGILSVHHIPLELQPSVGTSAYVRLAGMVFDGVESGGVTVSGNPITAENHIAHFQVPTVYLDHEHGELPYFSFEDFARTRVRVYLPYCGTVELDPASCIGGSIEIDYQCDCINGNVGVQITTTTKPDQNGNQRRHVSAVATGNCAYKIPMTGNDNGTGEILGAVTGAFGSMMSGNFLGALSGGLRAISGIEQHHTNTTGSISGNAGFLTSRTVIVEVTYGDYYKTDGQYPAMMMRPAASSGMVSDFSGHSQLIVHADSISIATDAERAEIETMCRNGVLV